MVTADESSSSAGLDPGELQSRALRAVSWSSLATVVSLPVAIAVSVVLARSLGPEGFARFAYLSFLIPLLFTASDLGFGQATTREASRAFAAGDLAATRALVRKALGWNLVRLPLIALLALAVARPGPLAGAVLVASLALMQAGSGLLFSLHAENRGAALARIALLQALVVGTASAAAALAGAGPVTVWVAAVAAGAVAVPAWALAASPALRRAGLAPALPRRLPAGFWRFAVTALAVALGSILVFSRSEVLLLDLLAEPEALAVFALAFGLAQRLTTPVDTMLGPLIPALSALDRAHPERLRAGFDRALRLSSAGVACLAAGALVGTALLASVLYGPAYEGVGTAFVALALVALLRSAAQPYTALAHALGRPGIVLRALSVAVVVDVAVAVLTIPYVGLWGAVAANAAGGVSAVVLAARATAGRASLRRAGVAGGRLALAVGAALALSALVGVSAAVLHPVAGAAAAYAVGLCAFVAVSRASGGLLENADAGVLLGLLPRRPAVARAAALLVRA